MATHILKTIDTVWDAVAAGDKRFEVRRNDRFFQHGDTVILRKINDGGLYVTPRGKTFGTMDLEFTIGWTLQGGQFGIEPGYCVFQLVAPAPPSAHGGGDAA